MIAILQIKYFNSILEQDHRFIKRITKHMLGFKVFHSVSVTSAGIEVAPMRSSSQMTIVRIPALCGARSISVPKNKHAVTD